MKKIEPKFLTNKFMKYVDSIISPTQHRHLEAMKKYKERCRIYWELIFNTK
jgi:hypothetical protein